MPLHFFAAHIPVTIPSSPIIPSTSNTNLVITKPPSVCVIGAGPGGMFFLHALASRRRKLEEELEAFKKQDGRVHNAAAAARANCEAKLAALPVVDCYEKSSSPGGVWRSASASSGGPSTQMYEALWINGNKQVQEFFDYTFDEHFQRPMPVYLPRAHVLDYMISRVTRKSNIFEDVLFNTAVVSVNYNSERKEFDVVSRNEITGELSIKNYDKCIWSGGLNAEARMPRDLVTMLSQQNFQGRVIHSTEMNDFEATVRGKRVLFIGDAASAEDLALQSIKLGAEQIYITSRGGDGTASYVNAWPGDRVKVLWHMLPTGVTTDGKGITLSSVKLDYSTERYEPEAGGKIVELEDISTVVMCTGYNPNFEILSDELKPHGLQKESKWVWSVPEEWKMKPNTMTDEVGEVIPSEELGGEYLVKRGLYRRALINNPNMMFLHGTTDFPLLEVDVAASLCLAYVCGDAELPTADEMETLNFKQQIDEMSVPYLRYYKDKNYWAALNNLPEDHWWSNYTSTENRNHYKEYTRYQIQTLARDTQTAGYPAGFGSYEKLSERGEMMVDMTYEDSACRYRLNSDDPDSSWRTFRDCDPSPFKSIFTGTRAVPLKGKWVDLDHLGEVSTGQPFFIRMITWIWPLVLMIPLHGAISLRRYDRFLGQPKLSPLDKATMLSDASNPNDDLLQAPQESILPELCRSRSSD